MDFPCTANSCIVFTVLLLIMAASCVHATSHAPQLTASSWGGQFYPGAIIRRRSYEGTQAAMKIMINAAYGYMGATSMALFGDLGAANEVTRRGRGLLDQIIEALRERGMVPIEADTDGVYFATPHEWSEAEERALVDEIGTTLPAGIRLEYESRYAAMVSHAIKNYALLSYS